MNKNPEDRANINQIKATRFFRDLNFTSIYKSESPLFSILRTQTEHYFFRGEAMVRIDEDSRKRIVGLLSRSVDISAKNLRK
jgi:hypothetical protein